MTPNARWSIAVRDRDHGLCCAERHDPRCRLIGHHGHHIVFRSHAPAFTHFTVLSNGVWVSNYCHDLAHKTHNATISTERKIAAVNAINAKILEVAPHKPELLVKHFPEAA